MKEWWRHLKSFIRYYYMHKDLFKQGVRLDKTFLDHVEEYQKREKERLLSRPTAWDVIEGKVPVFTRSDRVNLAIFDYVTATAMEKDKAKINERR